ncbi:MAG: S-layer homology domain-containing protein [Acutalibacter sp.]|nr:S-layer homology domain-containing protein [Acutalibacter sp.]
MSKLFRRFMAASAAALMLAAPMTAHAAAEKFTDVKPGAWYYDAVDYAASEGLFNGTGPSTFDPEGGMTRGMFVTVLANKTDGFVAGRYKESTFADVAAGQWYAPPVGWASQNKLVGGVGNGRFAPNDSVTREQIAKILYDYAQQTGNDTSADESSLQGFGDAGKVSSWARQAMAWATTHRVIKGDGGRLDPQGTATRAQVAQIFYNSRGLLTSSTILSPAATWVVDVPGHYETVTRLELQEVTVGEVGHWEDVWYTEWVYECNQCGYIGKTVEEISKHIEDSIDWDSMLETGEYTGCSSYTMVSGDPIYTGEKYWVIDVPGHTELKMVEVKEEVWVEEAGHWEYN